jgi:uncharacterized protein YcbK (DUF882 family)
MDGESAKIRIKIGAIEIEYEGKASFLQDELLDLVQNVVGFYAEHKAAIHIDTPQEKAEKSDSGGSSTHLDHSTNTIAGHLGATSGSDLAIAAAARLTFVKKREKFTHREIDTEMKSATTYYNKNMSSNLSSSLNTLVRGKRLNQVGKDVYALSANEKTTLEAKLAQPF